MKAAVLLPLLTACAIAEAAADPVCMERGQLVGQLEKTYGEIPVGWGQDIEGRWVEFWFNPRTGSWTLLATRPGGETCVTSGGGHWQLLAPPRRGPGI